MTWVETRSEEDAGGPLAELYHRIAGGGRVANILKSHSLHAEGVRYHYLLYRTLMFGPSPLSRAEREAIAVAVSVANDCHY